VFETNGRPLLTRSELTASPSRFGCGGLEAVGLPLGDGPQVRFLLCGLGSHVVLLAHVETIPQHERLECLQQARQTFTAQVEALKRYRSGGEQKMTVQHVHVAEGGQAIVGNVNAPTEGQGAEKI
jgi:hypothetical protein